MENKTIKIGIAGVGTVGCGVINLLKKITKKYLKELASI